MAETNTKDLNNEHLDEELQKILYDLVESYEKEEGSVRAASVKEWKKNEYYWHGLQYIFWSEGRNDWIPASSVYNALDSSEGREGADEPFYDYVINIYRSHGESVIAALSSQVPSVRFPPDDADNEEDLITSKTYSKIGDLVQKHNNAKNLLLQILFILWNQGNVFIYHCPKSDEDYGKSKIQEYGPGYACDQCGQTFSELPEVPSVNPESADESLYAEDPEFEIEAPAEIAEGNCPQCNIPLEERPIVIGEQEVNKSRVIIEVFGNLEVKISHKAKKQKDLPYLFKLGDYPVAYVKSIFPHIAEKLDRSDSDEDGNERSARQPTSSAFASSDEGDNRTRTVKRCWLRNWVLADLPEDKSEEKAKLEKLFPDGIYVCFVGSQYAESRNEKLDKYWTIGKAGLSGQIIADPIGQPLVPVQELKNVLTNLTIDTVEHGIPSSFADKDVLDFDTYGQHESRPGMIYPVKAAPGQRIGDAFFEGARATLSKEVPAFADRLDHEAQFVVGSFPSIYGGPGEGKSRTAAEYNMSRQMALQRLSISWAYVVFTWAAMIEKSVKLYAESMIEDDKFVKKENDNYVNVWIRRAEMTGKVGEVEPEGAETFPVSTPQKQKVLFDLLNMKNEFIDAALFDPENRQVIADMLAFPDLYIPGQAQRVKQAIETQEMLKGIPVQADPLVDDHQIHAASLRNFMVGTVGLDAKKTNPQGYAALEMHLQEHEMLAQANMAPTDQSPPVGGGNNAPEPAKKREPAVQGVT